MNRRTTNVDDDVDNEDGEVDCQVEGEKGQKTD